MAKQEVQTMTESLKSLRIGSETTLTCRNPTHCESVRSLCYRIPLVYPEHKNKKYSCVISYQKSQIKIKVTSAK